jgi:hypothetical protein
VGWFIFLSLWLNNEFLWNQCIKFGLYKDLELK